MRLDLSMSALFHSQSGFFCATVWIYQPTEKLTHTSSYIVDYSRNLSTVSNRFYVLFYDAVTVWHNAVICKR